MNLIVISTNLSKHQKERERKKKLNIHGHTDGGTFISPLDGTKTRVILNSENSPIS